MPILPTPGCGTMVITEAADKGQLRLHVKAALTSDQVKVSVLIPVYNAGEHLSRCLDSLAAQTFGDFEVIALNDGSTDDSLSRLRAFAAKHPFLRVETQSNAGAPTTRNRLIKLARGEFVMFLDDDDTYEPDCIGRFVAEAERTGADIVCGGYRRVSTDGRVLSLVHMKDAKWSPLVTIMAWTKIYRRDFLVKNHVEFFNYGIGEDIGFSFKAYRAAGLMTMFHYAGYNWTFNKTSVSNTTHRAFRPNLDPIRLLDHLFAISGAEGLYGAFYVRHVIWHLFYSGRGSTSEEFLRQSERLFAWLSTHGIPARYPFSWHFWKAGDFRAFLIVRFYLALRRLGLVNLFARIYCLGRGADSTQLQQPGCAPPVVHSPQVSVLIPVYNAGEHLRRCLDSLASQTFNDFEAVALDDGSTDDSLSRLRAFAADHPFLRIETQANAGVPTTRNRLIKMARGEFIMFMDDDDAIAPDYISRYVAEARRTGADVVCGGYKRVSVDGRPLFAVNATSAAWSPYLVVTPWAKIYKKRFLVENDMSFFDYGLGEDMPFCLRAYKLANPLAVFNYTGYVWVHNGESVSSTVQKVFSPDRDPVRLLDECFAMSGADGISRYFYVRYAVWYSIYAGRGATPDEFLAQVSRLFAWLSEHGIPARYPLFRHRLWRGDMRVFTAVVIFLLIRRINLLPVFTRIICRGERGNNGT